MFLRLRNVDQPEPEEPAIFPADGGAPTPAPLRPAADDRAPRENLVITWVERDVCPICMYAYEAGERVAIPPCGHRFHDRCLSEWIRRRAVCPECRAPIALGVR